MGDDNGSLAVALFTERYLENLGCGEGAVCVSDAIDIWVDKWMGVGEALVVDVWARWTERDGPFKIDN